MASDPDGIPTTASVRRAGLRKRLYDLGWALYGMGSLVLGGTMAAAALFHIPTPLPDPVGVVVGLFALGMYAWPVLLVAGLVAGRERRLDGARVRSDGARGVELTSPGGDLHLPARALRQGAVAGPSMLVLEDDAGREITLEAPRGAAARLLDELDLDPQHRRFTFRWRNTSARVWSFLGAIFGASFLSTLPMIALGRSEAPPLAALACLFAGSPWLVAELVSRWWAWRELTVGLDGVAARSRRGKRVVRFADVAHVESRPTELVFVMKDGARIPVLADPAEPGVRRAIEDRIATARAIAARQAGTSAAPALLARAGRSLADWRDAAARILTAATGFRDVAVTPDELAGVIDDPGAPADQRLAAAIALGQRRDEGARARIRVAAEASASPKLRVALEALADGEASDAALEAALAEAGARAKAR